MTNKNNIPDEQIYSKQELEFFKSLENDIENETYKPLDTKTLTSEKKSAKTIATNTISKMNRKKSLNLRVYEDDISNIKAIAMQKGLPYQTLLSSIIHQVATKQIKI